MRSPLRLKNCRPRGYTLIELLLVMGIIIMVITLVLLSVNQMLRSSKMARAVSLIVAAVDESRTAAITVRRTTRVDVTALDDQGQNSRMTVYGAGDSDNFEQYKLPDPTAVTNPNSDPPQDPQLLVNWRTSGKQPLLVADGSRCMQIRGSTGAAQYWFRGQGVASVTVNDYYESVLFARVKILPGLQRKNNTTMKVKLLSCIDDGNSRSIRSAYDLGLTIVPSSGTGRNDSSFVALERFGGGALTGSGPKDGPASVQFDKKQGTSSPTALLVEGVWYRMLLSVKSYTPDDSSSSSSSSSPPQAIVAGKIWADGQLEPLLYTVGPLTDKQGTPLSNGFGGFSVEGCDAVVDDFLFDMRPVRLIPQGITITPLDPDQSYNAADLNSKYSFPLMFRPDGTTSVFSIMEIADSSTGDKRFVRIDQNTGRARIKATLDDVKK
ncbi:MAG TPA: type II secretion system protein [Planctomycetota bacterium]|nr:type II secretion system protein [Planctomycetota bacterium]